MCSFFEFCQNHSLEALKHIQWFFALFCSSQFFSHISRYTAKQEQQNLIKSIHYNFIYISTSKFTLHPSQFRRDAQLRLGTTPINWQIRRKLLENCPFLKRASEFRYKPSFFVDLNLKVLVWVHPLHFLSLNVNQDRGGNVSPIVNTGPVSFRSASWWHCTMWYYKSSVPLWKNCLKVKPGCFSLASIHWNHKRQYSDNWHFTKKALIRGSHAQTDSPNSFFWHIRIDFIKSG